MRPVRLSLHVSLLCWLAASLPVLPRTAHAQQQPEEPGYLGLIADDREENGRGVRILAVLESSPADEGGLRMNDLIVAINESEVGSMQAMGQAIEGSRPGDELQFEVLRGEQSQSYTVTLGNRPPQEQRPFAEFGRIPDAGASGTERPASQAWLGVRVLDVDDATRRRMGRSNLTGAMVTEVVDGSPAQRAGLRAGSVIIKFDEQDIAAPGDLIALVGAAAVGQEYALEFHAPDGAPVRSTVTLITRGGAAAELPTPEPADRTSALPVPDVLPETPEVSEPEPPLVLRGEDSTTARIEVLEAHIAALEERLARIEQLLSESSDPATAAPSDALPAPSDLERNESDSPSAP